MADPAGPLPGEPRRAEEEEEGSESSSDDGGAVGLDEYEDHYNPGGDDDDLEALMRQRAAELSIPVEEVLRMKTDAILSCPGCFSTVCSFGSQRHTRFRHQYRALLADNVTVHKDVVLDDPRGAGSGSDQYYRVSCEVCGSDVGLQDIQDRAFHFYQVLPSEA
ncbi:hypothetical protein T492DRAFT_1062770 [Pavlovales sp. CCMP2436]|nr:hypothetical protein T492DRAFT_1062770 [Pavlovales sp. CCMP2436]|mmetsp:Transcript_18455/g.47188  ORF Transcript_18455/g.47188 Transcript_18455/m.47188 type:complete len:163 (-) Transcript_18455:246-734(-)